MPASLPASIGVRRRELLQVGSSALLGLSLASVLDKQAQAALATANNRPARAKSVIIAFQTGACSHHDTFDMKPEAAAEVRGPFQPIATPVAGFQVCEHLPRLAERAKKYAVVRSFSHRDNNHLMSTHHMLTGHLQPGGFFDKVASRTDWPCYAAACDHLKPPSEAIPSGVHLPSFLMQSPLTWPGQHGGLLAPKHDPWQITADPNQPGFRVDNLTLAAGIDLERLTDRRSLLAEINARQSVLDRGGELQRLTNQQQLAFSMLTSQRLTQAFELGRESDATRDRYGRHTYGQSLLLARRLVEIGVPVVQVNLGRVQTWDNHSNVFTTLKDRLLPPVDQGMAALLDDLEATGRIDDTLVILIGEFGRTPKINANAGRDHWGYCFSGLFAGAGVQGGQVIGKSDAMGGYPITKAYTPEDLGATVYSALGIDHEATIYDRQGRPAQLNQGTPMEMLYTGSEAAST
ncbi:MAG: DUF1501 domain-containing protein [Planctomycetia bacterium]|nr:DUF1501 domain-containing protein [Planctomycetia bacterium]